ADVQLADVLPGVAALAQTEGMDAGPPAAVQADGALDAEAVLVDLGVAAAAEAAGRRGHGHSAGGGAGAAAWGPASPGGLGAASRPARASATAARTSENGSSTRKSVVTRPWVSRRSRRLTDSGSARPCALAGLDQPGASGSSLPGPHFSQASGSLARALISAAS